MGGLIGHSTGGRRSLSTVGGTHVCPPQPWREIDAHAWLTRYPVILDKVLLKCVIVFTIIYVLRPYIPTYIKLEIPPVVNLRLFPVILG